VAVIGSTWRRDGDEGEKAPVEGAFHAIRAAVEERSGTTAGARIAPSRGLMDRAMSEATTEHPKDLFDAKGEKR